MSLVRLLGGSDPPGRDKGADLGLVPMANGVAEADEDIQLHECLLRDRSLSLECGDQIEAEAGEVASQAPTRGVCVSSLRP